MILQAAGCKQQRSSITDSFADWLNVQGAQLQAAGGQAQKEAHLAAASAVEQERLLALHTPLVWQLLTDSSDLVRCLQAAELQAAEDQAQEEADMAAAVAEERERLLAQAAHLRGYIAPGLLSSKPKLPVIQAARLY